MPHYLRQEVQGYSSRGEELLEKGRVCHLFAYCLFAYLPICLFMKESARMFFIRRRIIEKEFIHVALGEVALNHVNN